MNIRGVWGDEAGQLDPDQWVIVWQVSLGGLEFYCTCQVEDLDDLDPEECVLELVEVQP